MTMKSYVDGKVVVITGAASGFGRLLSVALATMGARVVCADVNEEGLAATLSEIEHKGGTARGCKSDVTNLVQMHSLAQTAISEFGGIDVLVNNAGVMPLAFYADHAEAMPAWERCIDINFKGVLNGIVAVHDQMISQGQGHIVNLSSIYSNFPVAGAGVYGATKAAVNFLSESLRVESQGKIKVTTIKPTGVPDTGLNAGIVNRGAVIGILGERLKDYVHAREELEGSGGQSVLADVNSCEYFSLSPELLVEQIVYAINQPLGVSIAEITVRASGERFVL